MISIHTHPRLHFLNPQQWHEDEYIVSEGPGVGQGRAAHAFVTLLFILPSTQLWCPMTPGCLVHLTGGSVTLGSHCSRATGLHDISISL